jgi:hypothetical protein
MGFENTFCKFNVTRSRSSRLLGDLSPSARHAADAAAIDGALPGGLQWRNTGGTPSGKYDINPDQIGERDE